MFDIQNRRYTGCKYKLLDKISEIVKTECKGDIFCDIFAGTGVVSAKMLPCMKKIIINDFLYSNEIIYNGFFLQENFDCELLEECKKEFNSINAENTEENYFSVNFGGKYYSYNDALLIGEIRERIKKLKNNINQKEYYILLSSLIYSMDKISNTVGHYDAYIKKEFIEDKFEFDLIKPIKCDTEIEIHREDSNVLARKINADIVYIDPPYNSRQYGNSYHLLENIAYWEKKQVFGIAGKVRNNETKSQYCLENATETFRNLINNLDCKYIILSYNNMAKKGNSRSNAKITDDSIMEILSEKGNVSVFSEKYKLFSAGKTNIDNNEERLFLCDCS